MSRITQVVSNTNTVVKKIVVGTPIKRVSGNITNFGNINSANPLHGQTLLYDSDLGKFVPSNAGIDSAAILSLIDSDYITSRVGDVGIDSAAVTSLIDADYINNLVDPNLVPEVQVDSNLIKTIVDSAYINARVTGGGSGGGIDSAATIKLVQGIDNYFQRSYKLADVDSDTFISVGTYSGKYKEAQFGFDSANATDSDYADQDTIRFFTDAAERLVIDDSGDIRTSSSYTPTTDYSLTTKYYVDQKVSNLYLEAFDSALVQQLIPSVVDSAYIGSRIQYHNDFARERVYDSAFDSVGNLYLRMNRTAIPPLGQEVSLGTINRPFQDLFLSPNSLVIGRTKISEAGDGTLTFTKIGDDGEELEGAAANAVSFSFRDSDIGKVQSFVYDQDSNKITLEIANQDTIVLNIDRMNDLELLGELKGPQDFVIAPFPHDGPTGQLTVRGRLFVEGDEFATDAATVRFNQAKTLELGTTFDSAIDANGGGLILGGANVYLRYNYNTDRWQTNKGIIATDFQGRYRGFDSDLINTNTDGLPEGGTNLYYTQTRVDNRVQQVVDETYIRSRQLTTQLDSNQIANIVVQYVDSDYQGSVQNLLNQLDSSQSIVRGIVDSDYITSKFKAVNGKVTTVSVDPSQTEYVFQPADSDILYVQDSDISGKLLRFDRDNVSVYLNGSRLVAPYDFTTDSHGRRITFPENIGPGNTIVVTSARSDKINFSNALVDSDQTIATDSAGRFDTFPKTSSRFAKYLITASVTVNSVAKYQASEVLVAHNDIDASYSEYGIVQTQDSSLGDVVAEIDGANVKVSFDPEYANTTVKFSRLTL